jgi:hypothetical protein
MNAASSSADGVGAECRLQMGAKSRANKIDGAGIVAAMAAEIFDK